MNQSSPFTEFLEDLAQVGVHAERHGTIYGLLAARTNRRWWLFPLDKGPKCASAGLEMFQAGNIPARLAKKATQLRAAWAPCTFGPDETAYLSGSPSFLDVFQKPDVCCAYFTGTDGPHRKTSAQVMTHSGVILGYAKMTRKLGLKRYIANEANYLQQLGELNLRAAEVPKLLSYSDGGTATWLVTDSLRDNKNQVTLEFGLKHAAFLSEVAHKTKRWRGLELFQDLRSTIQSLGSKLHNGWSDRFQRGLSWLTHMKSIPVCLAHGDFTPWNSFVLDKKLYVFDWEYAHPMYPVGYDHTHFLLSSNPDAPIHRMLDHLESAVSNQWYEGNKRTAQSAIILSLLIHASFYIKRSLEMGSNADDWSESYRRGKIVDAMLARI